MPTTYDGVVLDQGGAAYNVKSSAYGAILFSDANASSSSLGLNGDFCFRSNGSAGSVIYYTSGGAWSAIA